MPTPIETITKDCKGLVQSNDGLHCDNCRKWRRSLNQHREAAKDMEKDYLLMEDHENPS